jgi:2,3-bisphosphoglycerate-dependent phosphoglycerate mutase
MPRLVAALVRHGEYDQPAGMPSAHRPYPLTPAGEEQARRGASEIDAMSREHGLKLHSVLDSSRMLRAWQTATTMARTLQTLSAVRDVRVEEFDALAERGLGAAANLTVEDIEAIVREDPRHGPLPRNWKLHSDFRLPLQGAESLLDAGARTARHISNRLDSAEIPTDVALLKVFVGHGGAFRYAAVHLGVLAAAEASHLSMHHCRPVLIERVGANQWQHIGGHWKARLPAEACSD